jgi:hypothetical protein
MHSMKFRGLPVVFLMVSGCFAAEVEEMPPGAEILKEAPAKGTVRRGHIVYVDDGSCPTDQVTKIVGGSQQTGITRQVECVKRPKDIQKTTVEKVPT